MMCRTQSQPNRQPFIRETALQIKNEKGLQGFWSGYSASLVLTLNPSLTFFLFEFLKRLLVPRNQRNDPPAQATFLIAAVSKAVASTITYPFSMAKSRAQASSKSVNETKADASLGEKTHEKTDSPEKPEAQKPSNVFVAILQIAKAEGPSALYEGLGGEVLKGFFSHGLTMIVKQMVHRFIIQLYYATLRLLKRFPSPEVAMQSTKERTTQTLDTVQKDLEPVMSSTTEKLQDVSSTLIDSSQGALEKAQKSAEPLISSTTETLQNASTSLLDNSHDVLKKVQLEPGSVPTAVTRVASNVQGKTSDVLERAKGHLTTVRKVDEG
ncbi:MAG: hypothetical protein Q9169_000002 [Polycauliona sp. 2 TL-2023]